MRSIPNDDPVPLRCFSDYPGYTREMQASEIQARVQTQMGSLGKGELAFRLAVSSLRWVGIDASAYVRDCHGKGMIDLTSF
jgi:hypothetical protein